MMSRPDSETPILGVGIERGLDLADAHALGGLKQAFDPNPDFLDSYTMRLSAACWFAESEALLQGQAQIPKCMLLARGMLLYLDSMATSHHDSLGGQKTF